MEAPSDEKVEKVLEDAENGPYTSSRVSKKEMIAQLTLSKRLISDINTTNDELAELNQNLKNFTRWSRALTIALVILSGISLLEQFSII